MTAPRLSEAHRGRHAAGPDMAARQSRPPTKTRRMLKAPAAPGSDPDVAGFLRSLEGERGASPHTLVAYSRDLAQFARFVHDQRFTASAQVTPPLARRYAASLSRRYARSAIVRQLSAVRPFIRLLHRQRQ